MEKSNQLNHIMRNGLVDIQYQARTIGRQVDNMLRRCKEMEEALDKVEKEDKDPFSQLRGDDIDG